MIAGVLNLQKMESGSMVEQYFLIMEQMTQRKYNNKLVNHFGFVKNQENIDMFTY